VCPRGASVPARLKTSCSRCTTYEEGRVPTRRIPRVGARAQTRKIAFGNPETPHGVTTNGPVVQNKANLREAERRVTAVWRKGYGEKRGPCGRENKANFRGGLLPPPIRLRSGWALRGGRLASLLAMTGVGEGDYATAMREMAWPENPNCDAARTIGLLRNRFLP